MKKAKIIIIILLIVIPIYNTYAVAQKVSKTVRVSITILPNLELQVDENNIEQYLNNDNKKYNTYIDYIYRNGIKIKRITKIRDRI